MDPEHRFTCTHTTVVTDYCSKKRTRSVGLWRVGLFVVPVVTREEVRWTVSRDQTLVHSQTVTFVLEPWPGHLLTHPTSNRTPVLLTYEYSYTCTD